MVLNKSTTKGVWLELRGDIQKAWGQLTDNELDKTKGDFKSISGLIHQRYGKSQKEHRERLTEIFDRFNIQKDKALALAKKTVAG